MAALRKSAPKLDRATLRRLPRGVWALGLVSLWMDISSR